MKGYILDYSVQNNRGIISGDDNQRYSFNGADWMDSQPPRRGMQVDFAATGDQAAQVYVAIGAGRPYAYGGGTGARYSKSKIAAGLLGIFLGGLGIHKFYLGYTGARHYFAALRHNRMIYIFDPWSDSLDCGTD